MDKCKVYLLLSLFSLINVHADTRCNLKEIFKTPQRRNYDQLEIVERSNFLSDEPIQAEKCKSDFGVPNETFS
ncbi:hypothetical protein WA026_002545 [Henosepilachna vigintioctopunctata]|uniref:Uncharacterized protein n=1 Tax=Henosepilachna vigintioctopunctata TaxID=420089 RepID=A0AAW1TV77_9CUCU